MNQPPWEESAAHHDSSAAPLQSEPAGVDAGQGGVFASTVRAAIRYPSGFFGQLLEFSLSSPDGARRKSLRTAS